MRCGACIGEMNWIDEKMCGCGWGGGLRGWKEGGGILFIIINIIIPNSVSYMENLNVVIGH